MPVKAGACAAPGIVADRFGANLLHANAGGCVQDVPGLVRISQLRNRALVIDATGIDDVDSSAPRSLVELRNERSRRGIEMSSEVDSGHVLRILAGFGIVLDGGIDQPMKKAIHAIAQQLSVSRQCRGRPHEFSDGGNCRRRGGDASGFGSLILGLLLEFYESFDQGGMKNKELIEKARSFAKPFRIEDGGAFRLKDVDPGDTLHFDDEDKPRAKEALAMGVDLLAEFQDLLYAQDRWALLLVFQAMDAAGKDGTIKHVMSGVNPQGCQVTSFKAPSSVDLDHDYLWRCNKALPERGRIGIFNRSYYEETLVVRVHPDILARQALPRELREKDDIWKTRFTDIRHYEDYLTHNGIVVRKFFLHVSKKEQKKRFLERLEKPEKNWKFSAGDIKERGYWDAYMKAYEETIQRTATKNSPWYVVPADNKWFTRIVVAAAIIETMDSLNLRYPRVSDEARKQLQVAKQDLLDEE